MGKMCICLYRLSVTMLPAGIKGGDIKDPPCMSPQSEKYTIKPVLTVCEKTVSLQSSGDSVTSVKSVLNSEKAKHTQQTNNSDQTEQEQVSKC